MLVNTLKSIGLLTGEKVVSAAKSKGVNLKRLFPVAFMLAYFVGLVFMAKFSNPEFMDKSLGVVDSVIRAHLYAMFKVLTLNLNPIYIVAALYPFSLLVALWNWNLKRFFYANPKMKFSSDDKMTVFFVVLGEFLIIVAIVFLLLWPMNAYLKFIDVNMIKQLTGTKEVRELINDSALKDLNRPSLKP